ncbi:uncharacterized protein LOC110407892 isoform X4 [Numida meleagris]|uniref:uncharacterized protein LOC110407892 isoform X4 n=1 Tax=Numida meleagris TaxID=8996 RepID=UPI000B3D99C4|nr:uncharacterized protein LOC110407892 isoform X4 [Numida meleagris]
MGLGGERRERSAARRGAAAAGTERGPTGRVVAGGGRRLHNSPVAARRFLRGEVRAARPAPLPGTGPSAAGALGETIFVIQPCLSQPAARPSVGFHGKLPSKTRRKGVTAGVTQPQLEASVDEAEKGGTLPTSLVPLGQQGPGTAPNVFHSSLVPKSQCISAHGKAEHRNKTWTSKSEPLRCLRPVLLRDTGAGEAAAGPQCRLDRGEQTSLQCLLRAVPR